MANTTISIIAYNAEKSIARTLQSVRQYSDAPILLVDDGSTDQTATVAATAVPCIQVVRHPVNKGTGAARQAALEAVTTPYMVWVDADDHLCGPHIEEIEQYFERHTVQFVMSNAVLKDSETDATIGALEIPDFIKSDAARILQFERNWYPLMPCGIAVGFAKTIGYDTSLRACEDYDFMLRALMNGAKIGAVKTAHYAYTHSAHSISRDLGKTRLAIQHSFKKISQQQLHSVAKNFGASDQYSRYLQAVRAYTLDDYAAVVSMLAPPLIAVDEQHPAYGLQMVDLMHFLKASAHVQLGAHQHAIACLRQMSDTGHADILNNLGVCAAALDNTDEALRLIKQAVTLNSGYMDAKWNLEAITAGEIPRYYTSLPLRRQFGRSGYQKST